MYHNDPMKYTMEQLVKALAAETMNEIGYDDSSIVDECDTEEFYGIKAIANALLDEIDDLNDDATLQTSGFFADKIIFGIKPLVQSYAVNPIAGHLLSAIEELACQRQIDDPRTYITLVIKAMDSDAAKEWNRMLRKIK